MADVFISYHTDSGLDTVRRTADILERKGISCWYAARDIPGGDFASKIVQAIDSCRLFLVMLNEQSNASEDVKNEVKHAFGRYKQGRACHILTYRIGNCRLTDSMEYYLGRFTVVDYRSEGIPELAARVERLLSEKSESAPSHTTVQKRQIYRPTFDAGFYHTVAVRKDGTVLAAGNNHEGQCAVDGWHDIVSVSAGHSHTVGLCADGTVTAAGRNPDGQCDVGQWRDIVAVSAGTLFTMGLRRNGTVVTAGSNSYGQRNVEHWRDIVAISAGNRHAVGLKSDGTVVAAGGDRFVECQVWNWKNIKEIEAGVCITFGIRANGTVVWTGKDSYRTGRGTNDWMNLKAIASGIYHTAGLCEDGTVVTTSAGFRNAFSGAKLWRGILAIAAGENHIVGLKADNTMVVAGQNHHGQCDVSSWRDIRLPEWVAY